MKPRGKKRPACKACPGDSNPKTRRAPHLHSDGAGVASVPIHLHSVRRARRGGYSHAAGEPSGNTAVVVLRHLLYKGSAPTQSHPRPQVLQGYSKRGTAPLDCTLTLVKPAKPAALPTAYTPKTVSKLEPAAVMK